jgi:glyoxylase-like metal-dependent hydrolase (beta-lactamase superfamily II)
MSSTPPVVVAPAVRCVPLRTPTLPPATHTNCLIVGERRVAVIEPASPYPDQQRRLDQELDRHGGQVVAILLTHHHADHVGYAAALRDRLGVPLCAHRETAERVDFPIDRLLEDGEILDLGDGIEIEAVFTPGHAPGHLVYLERRSRIAHAGDMVAGEGTILIDPSDGGDMREYLASLERLGALGVRALVPAHGPVLEDPGAVVQHYIAHRLMRERKVLDAIGGEGAMVGEVLAKAYDDTPMLLWPLAARSLEAHLSKLVAEGRVKREGERVERRGG